MRHIVALRGDPPEEGAAFSPHAQGYANAAELVAGLKAVAPFEISVAAYPEVHPESRTREADLDNLKRKIDAGADRAISQFFFSAECFVRFQDAAANAGMNIEIVPGILPVSNVAQARRIAQSCGATIPHWLDGLFEGLDDLPGSAPADCCYGRGRALRPALCGRSARLSLLYSQPGGAQLCHLPPAWRESEVMTPAQSLCAEASRRIILKDGAYGTLIQQHKLDERDYRGQLELSKDQRGNNDLLNITRPEVVRSICASFADASAEILATNTFNANSISQSDFGAEGLVSEINRSSARIVREVADSCTARDGRVRWVAGAIGPTNKTLSLSPSVNDPGFREVDFDQVRSVYREQIDALVEGGVDFILVETIFDTLNAKAAIMATLDAEQDLGASFASDDFDDLDGSFGKKSLGPYGGSLLGFCPSRQADYRRAELLVRSSAAPAPSRRSFRNRGYPCDGLSQCGPSQRTW